ncbi:hypothetical protein ApDm4_2477 [Acetobacter pomorum]|nr:hypothetical protein ApDm4_2477 [Acetobacter pomorum]
MGMRPPIKDVPASRTAEGEAISSTPKTNKNRRKKKNVWQKDRQQASAFYFTTGVRSAFNS